MGRIINWYVSADILPVHRLMCRYCPLAEYAWGRLRCDMWWIQMGSIHLLPGRQPEREFHLRPINSNRPSLIIHQPEHRNEWPVSLFISKYEVLVTLVTHLCTHAIDMLHISNFRKWSDYTVFRSLSIRRLRLFIRLKFMIFSEMKRGAQFTNIERRNLIDIGYWIYYYTLLGFSDCLQLTDKKIHNHTNFGSIEIKMNIFSQWNSRVYEISMNMFTYSAMGYWEKQ